MSYEMHKQLKRTEAMALKYQQHQESLSAQLQGKKDLQVSSQPTAAPGPEEARGLKNVYKPTLIPAKASLELQHY